MKRSASWPLARWFEEIRARLDTPRAPIMSRPRTPLPAARARLQAARGAVSYRIRFHPAVAGNDLDAIIRWLIDYAGPQSAASRLDEIEATIASLADLPHKGSRRDEIAPGLRAIPAGRKAVIAFTVGR